MVSVAMVEGVKLGLDVDWKDGRTLYIKKILDGAVSNYNKSCAGDKVVQGGDRIIAINGQFDDPKAMLNECKTHKKLQLLVRTTRDLSAASRAAALKAVALPAADLKGGRLARALRPLEFMAALDMAGQMAMGVEVDWADGRTLYVKSVQQVGAIAEWNRSRPVEFAISPGARILAVNGYADNPEAMASLCRELCAAQVTIQLRVLGPPLPPVAPAGAGATVKEKASKPEQQQLSEKPEKSDSDAAGAAAAGRREKRPREEKEKKGREKDKEEEREEKEKEKKKKKKDKEKDKDKKKEDR